MNSNVLYHPEVASLHNGSTQSSLPTSNILPDNLNLSQDLSGSLVDHIIVHKKREASDRDDALEQMKRRKVATEKQIKSQNKRMMAGLLTSSSHFHLSVTEHNYVQDKANEEQETLVCAQL